MSVLVVPGDDGAAMLVPLGPAGEVAGRGERVGHLGRALTGRDERWVWADTAAVYRSLHADGRTVARCHDLALTEGLLLGSEGRWGEPRSVIAAWARLLERPVPADPTPHDPHDPLTLFPAAAEQFPSGVDHVEAHAGVYAGQLRRIAATTDRHRFGLLVAAESAGALAAVEMSATGLPWSCELHSRALHDLLGPRTAGGVRPTRLAALAAQICDAFGGGPVNPDSPAEVLAAFAAAGHELESTRRWVLRAVTHPAVSPLLEYKQLSRILAANGWAWQDRWVHEGRFRPSFVPGGVVSGRWATRGGGGLQIPRLLKGAAVADPGYVLVVADAGQLEPRLLAALSGDPGMCAAAGADDLYSAIAARSFRGDRARAKIGLLGAMYGQVGGQAAAPLAVLREQYPAALRMLEDAAYAGEHGGLVRSHLGRTCPPAHPDLEPGSAAARTRGRFTRNFLVQATAAEWALCWLALTRAGLAEIDHAELVFFVHDELVVHCRQARAGEVIDVLRTGAARSSQLLFGAGAVAIPLDVSAVGSYAEAG